MEALAVLSARGVARTFQAGEVLMRQGDAADAAYVLVSGAVRVERAHEDLSRPLVLAELGAGEVVGEMGVLERAPRSATVTAIERTETLRLDASSFEDTMREHPAVAGALLRAVSRRLRSADVLAERARHALVSHVSHELRTPLTAIRGYVDLLLEGELGPLSEEQSQALGIISRNVVRLTGAVEEVVGVVASPDAAMRASPTAV